MAGSSLFSLPTREEPCHYPSMNSHEAILKEVMPFKSEKQRRYLWKNNPVLAQSWSDKYGSKAIRKEAYKKLKKNASPPATVDDTVLYTLNRNFYGDKDITVRMLDGSVLDIWGPVYVNGSLIVDTAIGIPIASQAEALAGTNNTKVMTPLRVREASNALYLPLAGGTVTGALSVNGGLYVNSTAYFSSNIGIDGSLNADSILIQSSSEFMGNVLVGESLTAENIYAITLLGSDGDFYVTGHADFNGTISVPYQLYGPSWGGSSAPPTMQAVYDKIESLTFSGGGGITQEEADLLYLSLDGGVLNGDLLVPHEDYGPSWSGSAVVPTKDALWDKIETLGTGAVASVNGKTGVVTLNQDEVLDGATYKRYSQTEKTKLSGIATGATANSSDATLLNRTNHTGTQSADTITDGTTNKTFSAAEDTKLAGIATGATANSSDAVLLARGNHTGTQSADTITNGSANKVFTTAEQTKLSGIAAGATVGLTQEQIEDITAALFAAGTHTNATVTYNDSTPSLSIATTGGGGSGITQAEADIRYVNVTGDDTITGDIISTSMVQADSIYGIGGVSTEGTLWVGSYATIVGRVTVESDAPVGAFGDPSIAIGTTTSDSLQLSGDSIQKFVSGSGSTLKLNPLGGDVLLSEDPTEPLGAATKQYVDANAGGGGGAVTSVNGETGVVVLNQDEVLDGTTYKQYSATEKTKLAGVATGATANSSDATLLARANHTGSQAQSTVTNLVTDLSNKQPIDTDLTTIAGLTATTDNIIQSVSSAWASRTPAQLKTSLTLVKADVGLGNVDNVSDANAPVSTAQQTALDLKANKAVTITATTPVRIDGGASADLSANRTISIANDSVTNTQLALMPTMTIKGNNSGSTAGPIDLNATQTKTVLALNNVDNTADTAKPVSTAQQTAIDLKAPLRYTINTQAGTTYTYALADELKLVQFTNGSAVTATVPTNATAAFAIGSKLDYYQSGAGKVTVAPAGGVTIRSTPTLALRAQYSAASLIKVATDEWLLAGDLG